MNIVAIAGTLSHPSRTATLLELLLEKIAAALPGSTTALINVADLATPLGTTLNPKAAPPELAAAYRKLFEADAVIIGTPVYKASYTGLLKHFFDLIDPKELRGKIAVLTANGGSDQHSLVIEHQLRPLVGFFGMYSVPSGLYVKDSELAKTADGSGYDPAGAELLQRIDAVVEQTLQLLRARATTKSA